MNKRDHGDGGIDQRSNDVWRLRYRINGKRYSKTFRGTKRAAQTELRRLLSADTHVEPSKTTIADYLREWLDNETDLSPKTLERYRQLAAQQIIPHLGSTALQALRPAQVKEWHATLLRAGGDKGRPLSARTVGHAHRVLHRALEQAVLLETVNRNVAHLVRPPKVDAQEIEILSPGQIDEILGKLDGHALYAIVATALGTGMRRGELCALAWRNLDIEKVETAAIRVERSLEETADGLRFKPPKTKNGRRTISLAASTVAILREHRIRQAELWMQLGLGRPGGDDLVFTLGDGSPYPPDKLSRDWGNLMRDKKLPRVMFHALRHSHVSALIAAGLDPVSVSRRVGHGSPAITLSVYSHLFGDTDRTAAMAIEAVLKRGS